MTPEQAARKFIERENGKATDAEIEDLAAHIQLVVDAERQACAAIASNAYRCQNCKEVFLSDAGHNCDSPDWQSLTNNDIAAAILARSVNSTAISVSKRQPAKDIEPDCLCGHPFHVGGCAEIVAGYEHNESCSCVEYEAEE